MHAHGVKAAGDGLRGLGPVSRAWLAELGVNDGAALARCDALALFLAIQARRPRASLNLLFALIGAQQGRDWREVARERRTDLLLELELRKSAATATPARPRPSVTRAT